MLSKFDEPALIAALATDAGYIGALGSRTHATPTARRACARPGVSNSEPRAHQLALRPRHRGAGRPAETAVAVVGEILALRGGRSGGRLAGGAAIHARDQLASTADQIVT